MHKLNIHFFEDQGFLSERGLTVCSILQLQGRANRPERILLNQVRGIQEVEDMVLNLPLGIFQVLQVFAAGQEVQCL